MDTGAFKYRRSMPHPWRRSAGWVLAFLALNYLLMAGHAYFFADRVIFQPSPPSYGPDAAILKVSGEGGSPISALYLPNRDAPYTILYSHGNAEDLGDIRERLARYHKQGFSIIAYDYRGYGTSPGSPSEKGACRDIDAVYDHLVGQEKVPPERIILYGRSLGGGPSVDLATRRPVAGLILESTFLSIFRVMARVPIFPFDKFDNLRKIGNIGCPAFVVHGKKDEVVPFWHGEELYRLAREPKMRLWVEEADHNNLLQVAADRYWQGLKRFRGLIERRGSPLP